MWIESGMWRYFLVLMASASVEAAESLKPVVGGISAQIEEYPFMASLWQLDTFLCGCFILSDRAVVTSAQCTHELDVNDLRVRVGTDNLDDMGEMYLVESKAEPYDYSPETLNNDIAIVFLTESCYFSDRVKTISISSVTPSGGEASILIGWGLLYEGASPPYVLQKLAFETVDRNMCSTIYSDYDIRANMSCASPLDKSKGVSQGNSGGILICGSEVVGITSWGRDARNWPGVFANCVGLRDFINTEQYNHNLLNSKTIKNSQYIAAEKSAGKKKPGRVGPLIRRRMFHPLKDYGSGSHRLALPERSKPDNRKFSPGQMPKEKNKNAGSVNEDVIVITVPPMQTTSEKVTDVTTEHETKSDRYVSTELPTEAPGAADEKHTYKIRKHRRQRKPGKARKPGCDDLPTEAPEQILV